MSFRGPKAEIPLGVDGLTGTESVSRTRPGHLLQANNIDFSAGTMRKEGGAEKYNSSAISGAPDVLGGWDWHPSASVQRMVVLCSDGKLYKDSGDGSFPVTLKSGLTVANVVPVFIDGGQEALANNRKLFICTGSNQVQVLDADGVTTADISTPSLDWAAGNYPTFGCIHKDRLWLFSGHIAYYSTLGDFEDFTGAGSGTVSCSPGLGDSIASALSYKGLVVVFKKPKGIVVIDASSVDTADWGADIHSPHIGTPSPFGPQAIDNDIVFLDSTGRVHALSAVTEHGNLGARSLGDEHEIDEFVRANINLGQLSSARGIYYAAKNQVQWAVAQAGSTVNDARFVLDLNLLGAPRFRFSIRETIYGFWLRDDDDGVARPVSGDGDGFVWLMDSDTRSVGGAYAGTFQTPHLDLSHLDPALGDRIKHGKFLELVAKPTGNWDLSVSIYWDDELKYTTTFNMGLGLAALGTFTLDTDTLGSNRLVSRRKKIYGSGKRLSLLFTNSGDEEDFSVDRATVSFTVGAEGVKS